jgi:effector-binding domain-containing protein
MTEPQIEERNEQSYLGIRCEVTEGVAPVVDRAFPQLFAWLGEQGVEPAGPPLIRYRELDGAGEPLEIEVAAPVSGESRGGGPVHAGTLPAGRYLTFLHVGPYRSEAATDLGDAQASLISWASERGVTYSRPTEHGLTLPCCVEHYRVGPYEEADWTKWETEIAYLIVEEEPAHT